MPPPDMPSLYGITGSNSSRQGESLWTKNNFNSTFPLALCLYMRDHHINPVSVTCAENGSFALSDGLWQMGQIVGRDSQEPYYKFESAFTPYNGFSRNVGDTIDLVVGQQGRPHLPLEIKLTVVPDSGTSTKPESEWGPELVMRPVSSAYAMMGVASSLRGDSNAREEAAELLKRAYNSISANAWGTKEAIRAHKRILIDALNATLKCAIPYQKPFLMQPIWKTRGQSFELCQQCLDVFVWSDVAIMMLPLDQAASTNAGDITREVREVARHVRALYDLLRSNDYDYTEIYKGMALGMQTDKAFALNGRKMRGYLAHERLQKPAMPSSLLPEIIRHGGHRMLKPERRFDAAVRDHLIQQE